MSVSAIENHQSKITNPLTLALSPRGERGQSQGPQPQTLYHKTWPFQPPFSPSGEKVAGGRMRGPGFLRFNEHEKDTKHKPPHPSPLPQGGEGTVAGQKTTKIGNQKSPIENRISPSGEKVAGGRMGAFSIASCLALLANVLRLSRHVTIGMLFQQTIGRWRQNDAVQACADHFCRVLRFSLQASAGSAPCLRISAERASAC